jgi:UDP-2,4-diacetamido-2,4,6-trideoxy-beta-L-altropyranose hydrolase
MKPEVYIRVDGNSEIGLGHLIRCIALAQMLENCFDITFVSIDIPESVKQQLHDNKFQLHLINNNDKFFDLIKPEYSVVLDGYDYDTDYQRHIKALGCKLICIDDLHNKEFCADLIINHSPEITPNDYIGQIYTQFALGPKYTLLRNGFLKHVKKERIIKKIETVLVCFGGSDYKNLTKNTLLVLQSFNAIKRIIVVTGAAYEFESSLSLLKENDNRITHHHDIDERQMLNLMSKSDLAIVPSSGILLEALAAGCLVISGMYIDNQKFIYLNYKKAGYFIDASDFSFSNLTLAIRKSFDAITEKKEFIDGNSGKRILKCFFQLLLKDEVKLRITNETDLEITYKWAIDPNVRAYSFNKSLITKIEHTNWFLTKIYDDKSYYFIAEMDNQKVGSIRFDIKDNEAIISYLVDNEYNGRGLGQVILILGLEYIENIKKTTSISIKKIIGYVLKNNAASIRIFEKMNFKKYQYKNEFKFEILT